AQLGRDRPHLTGDRRCQHAAARAAGPDLDRHDAGHLRARDRDDHRFAPRDGRDRGPGPLAGPPAKAGPPMSDTPAALTDSEIYERMISAILDHRLPPGTKL